MKKRPARDPQRRKGPVEEPGRPEPVRRDPPPRTPSGEPKRIQDPPPEGAPTKIRVAHSMA